MSLHSKDWLKIGLGAALLGLTGGLSAFGIPGVLGGEAAAGAGAAGAAGAEAAGAGTAAGLGATTAAATPAAGAGLGHALASFGAEAGKDAAKTAIVSGMLSPLAQQNTKTFGQMQPIQQPDPWAMFPNR